MSAYKHNTLGFRIRVALIDIYHRAEHWYERNYDLLAVGLACAVIGAGAVWAGYLWFK